jgi:peptidoglycan-N-acetylmuramic acid deacetylase
VQLKKLGVNIMRIKTAALLLIMVMLCYLVAGCSSAAHEGMDMPSMKDMDAPSPSFSPPTPAQTVSTPTPTVDSSVYTPAIQPSPSPDQSNNLSEKPLEPSIKVTPAKIGDLATLSWYYMKKGKGKVPNFPKETQSFTPEQKTVWVGSGKKVYLTFDNGGPMGDTKKLLQALKENAVKATFFIAGYNLKAHPEFLKELIADGHLVANHTMSHKDMTKLTDEQVKKELSNFENLYHDITGGEQPKYFRFPYGIYNKHLLSLVADLGYTSVFWSTAMKDWVPRKNGADDAYNDIMNNLHDGNVILMHQGSDDNIAALDRIVKGIKDAGYEFGLIDEL